MVSAASSRAEEDEEGSRFMFDLEEFGFGAPVDLCAGLFVVSRVLSSEVIV